MGTTVLDDAACMGVILDDGHVRGLLSWNWAGLWVLFRLWLTAHCTSQVLCATGSVGRALVLKVTDWRPRVTTWFTGCLQGLSFRKLQDVPVDLGGFSGRCLEC